MLGAKSYLPVGLVPRLPSLHMPFCFLPFHTTYRHQQLARIFTRLPCRWRSSIYTRTQPLQRFSSNMGAQKLPSEEGYAQTPLNTIKVYKHRGSQYLSKQSTTTLTTHSQPHTTIKPSTQSSPPPSSPTSPSSAPTKKATQHP